MRAFDRKPGFFESMSVPCLAGVIRLTILVVLYFLAGFEIAVLVGFAAECADQQLIEDMIKRIE